jgi:hypothetical protein
VTWLKTLRPVVSADELLYIVDAPTSHPWRHFV